jgi:hypothetical protein
MGQGAMTGGRRGGCVREGAPGGTAPTAWGFGAGRGGRGRGNGWRNRRSWAAGPDVAAAPAPAAGDIAALRAEVLRIEQALTALIARFENKETP